MLGGPRINDREVVRLDTHVDRLTLASRGAASHSLECASVDPRNGIPPLGMVRLPSLTRNEIRRLALMTIL
jgi:hypothetical protein